MFPVEIDVRRFGVVRFRDDLRIGVIDAGGAFAGVVFSGVAVDVV